MKKNKLFNITVISIRSGILYGAWLLIATSFLFSCSKSSDDSDPNPEPVSDTMFNRVITVLNYGADLDGDAPTTQQKPMFFSLEQNATVNPDYAKTDRWDISFSALYRSFIGGNNGVNQKNFGAGGPGKGGVLCVEKAFEEVTEIPDDAQLKTGSSIVGTDDNGAFGEGVGYYLYDFGGSIIGDGSYDKQHVAYCLGNELSKSDGTTITPRTILVKTAKGHYAKIKMLSVYRDLLDPSTWTRNSPHMYFSFQYVLVRSGSKNFSVK
jgi:hypothetical protein